MKTTTRLTWVTKLTLLTFLGTAGCMSGNPNDSGVGFDATGELAIETTISSALAQSGDTVIVSCSGSDGVVEGSSTIDGTTISLFFVVSAGVYDCGAQIQSNSQTIAETPQGGETQVEVIPGLQVSATIVLNESTFQDDTGSMDLDFEIHEHPKFLTLTFPNKVSSGSTFRTILHGVKNLEDGEVTLSVLNGLTVLSESIASEFNTCPTPRCFVGESEAPIALGSYRFVVKLSNGHLQTQQVFDIEVVESTRTNDPDSPADSNPSPAPASEDDSEGDVTEEAPAVLVGTSQDSASGAVKLRFNEVNKTVDLTIAATIAAYQFDYAMVDLEGVVENPIQSHGGDHTFQATESKVVAVSFTNSEIIADTVLVSFPVDTESIEPGDVVTIELSGLVVSNAVGVNPIETDTNASITLVLQ